MRFAVFGSQAERRDGLKTLLRQIDRQARFCDAKDWAQASRVLQGMPTDLLVVDWQNEMRASDTRLVLGEHPSLRIAVFIDEVIPSRVRALFNEGVHGIIPRVMNPHLIVRLLELVLAGGHYVPHGVLALAFDSLLADTTLPTVPIRESGMHARDLTKQLPRLRFAHRLSPRQEQIMRCVHMGSTNKMIARTLGISEGTVKIHLATIFQQLGAPNRAAAVAIYNGWLSPQLEVLRPENESKPAPVLGQVGPAPLRRTRNTRFKYPLPHEEAATLPIAAEPVTPFGEGPTNGH